MVISAKSGSLGFADAIVNGFDGAKWAFWWARGFGFEFKVWASVVRDWDEVAFC